MPDEVILTAPDDHTPGWPAVLAPVALAVAVLTTLSWRHPGLRLVDFLGFSARGHRLLSGEDLVHPLYPSGYPALLGLLQAGPFDPITAGRVLSIGAAALAVGVVSRWLGPAAGVWLLVQPVFLTYGASEGTDLPAFALGLTALALRSSKRPALAGAALGLAALTRYTSAALLPVVLWPHAEDTHRKRTFGMALGAFIATTLPHWGVALVTGAPVLPDQSSNFAIGANAVVHGLGVDSLARLPSGLASAVPFVFSGPGVGLGLLALVIAAILSARARTSTDAPLRLGAWGLIHVTLVAVAFANTRLVLPTRLAWALGLAVLLRSRPRILLGLSVAVGLWTLPPAWSRSTGEVRLTEVVDLLASLDGPLRTGHFLTTDPWVHRRNGARLESGTPMREAGGDPRTLDARRIADFARARGDVLVVVDVGRVHATYPGLTPLLQSSDTATQAGLRPVGRTPGYRVFAVEPAPESP